MVTFASAAPIVAPGQSSVNHNSASTQESLFLWTGRQITLLAGWITKQAFDAFHFLTTFTAAPPGSINTQTGPINTRMLPWSPITLAPTINSSHIFSYLDHITLRSCTRVSKIWQTQTTTAAILREKVQYQELMRNKQVTFGPDDWRTYFGNPGVVPPLDPRTYKILKSPCPFWPGKRVEQTHRLLYLPAAINGARLTVNSLGKLAEHPQGGGAVTGCDGSTYTFVLNYASEGSTGWLLITKEIIPGSKGKSFYDQATLLNTRRYRVARVGETVALAFTRFVSSQERLLSNTYTRCNEKSSCGDRLVVGRFSGNGINVDYMGNSASNQRNGNGLHGIATGIIGVLPVEALRLDHLALG